MQTTSHIRTIYTPLRYPSPNRIPSFAAAATIKLKLNLINGHVSAHTQGRLCLSLSVYRILLVVGQGTMRGREGDSVLAAQSEYTIYAKYRRRRLARSCGQSLRIIIFVWHFINYAQMRRSCTHTNTLANNINIYLEILAPIATTHCPSLAYNIVCTYWRIYARMPTPNMPHNHTNVMKKKKMNHSTIYWGDAYAHTNTYTQRT